MKDKVKYYIVTDTHFEHQNILNWCQRKSGYEKLIIKNLKNTLTEKDVLIHLGDVAWKNETYWHERLINEIPAKKKWLIKGNHDKRTYSWYLERGWDFVGEEIILEVYGMRILFSHKPVINTHIDINIHGHFHNCPEEKWESYLKERLNKNHILLKMEHEYKPFNLRHIVEKMNENIFKVNNKFLSMVYSKGLEVFEDEKKLEHWLNTPSIILSNKKPINLMNSEKNIQKILNELKRIENGILG
jgi:calcineurin-like phosphoesterase family protein